MKKIILACSIVALFISHLSAQLSDVEITLEDNSILEGKADEGITTKGFEGLMFYQGQEQQYIRFSELKKITFGDHTFVKQPIKYQSLETEILIENFVGGDVILYKGLQLDGERLFFIGRKNEEAILKINNKGIDNFLNYYFEDCSSWQKIDFKRAVYREDWFVRLAQKNKTCFAANENFIVSYQPKKVNLAIGGGINYYKIDVTDSGNNFIYDPEQFMAYSSFSARGLFQVIFNDYIRVQQSVSFYQFNTSSSYVNYHPFSVRENYSELDIQLSYIELQGLVRINWLKKRLSPFTEIGLNTGKLHSSDSQEVAYERNGYSNPSKSFNFTKTQVAPLFGGGITYLLSEKLELGIHYNYLLHRFTIILSPGGSGDVNPNLALSQKQNRIGLFFIYHL